MFQEKFFNPTITNKQTNQHHYFSIWINLSFIFALGEWVNEWKWKYLDFFLIQYYHHHFFFWSWSWCETNQNKKKSVIFHSALLICFRLLFDFQVSRFFLLFKKKRISFARFVVVVVVTQMKPKNNDNNNNKKKEKKWILQKKFITILFYLFGWFLFLR